MVATITGQPLAASDARDRSGTAGNSAADRARPPSTTSRRAADRHLGPSRRLATPVSDARSAWMASRTRCSVTCASPRSAGRSGVVPARVRSDECAASRETEGPGAAQQCYLPQSER